MSGLGPAGLSGDRCGRGGGAAAANLLPAGSTSAASDALSHTKQCLVQTAWCLSPVSQL